MESTVGENPTLLPQFLQPASNKVLGVLDPKNFSKMGKLGAYLGGYVGSSLHGPLNQPASLGKVCDLSLRFGVPLVLGLTCLCAVSITPFGLIVAPFTTTATVLVTFLVASAAVPLAQFSIRGRQEQDRQVMRSHGFSDATPRRAWLVRVDPADRNRRQVILPANLQLQISTSTLGVLGSRTSFTTTPGLATTATVAEASGNKIVGWKRLEEGRFPWAAKVRHWVISFAFPLLVNGFLLRTITGFTFPSVMGSFVAKAWFVYRAQLTHPWERSYNPDYGRGFFVLLSGMLIEGASLLTGFPLSGTMAELFLLWLYSSDIAYQNIASRADYKHLVKAVSNTFYKLEWEVQKAIIGPALWGLRRLDNRFSVDPIGATRGLAGRIDAIHPRIGVSTVLESGLQRLGSAENALAEHPVVGRLWQNGSEDGLLRQLTGGLSQAVVIKTGHVVLKTAEYSMRGASWGASSLVRTVVFMTALQQLDSTIYAGGSGFWFLQAMSAGFLIFKEWDSPEQLLVSLGIRAIWFGVTCLPLIGGSSIFTVIPAYLVLFGLTVISWAFKCAANFRAREGIRRINEAISEGRVVTLYSGPREDPSGWTQMVRGAHRQILRPLLTYGSHLFGEAVTGNDRQAAGVSRHGNVSDEESSSDDHQD